MHCPLLNLSFELYLIVIKELLRDEYIGAYASGGITNDDNHDDDLNEKHNKEIKFPHDLISWSCTSSYFRNLLAPHIFKTVTLRNDQKSGSSLNALAKSAHKAHVKELYFIGFVDRSEEAAFPDTERIFPRSVDALLGDLQQFQNLQKLSIRFLVDHFLGAGLDSHEAETPEQVLAAEASKPWRALMAMTYSALTRNRSPGFKHFEISQLIWRKVSTFSDSAFHKLLSCFEQLTLSIHDLDIGAPINPGSNVECSVLMGKLNEYFFNYSSNVTNLSITSSREGYLGLDGRNHASLALWTVQMPLLKTLYLEHIFVSSELITFLTDHNDTLEELILRDCYATSKGLLPNVHWSQFFDRLFYSRPARLRRFEIVDSKTPLTLEESHDEDEEEYDVEMSDNVYEVRMIMWRDPGRSLFPYAWVDDELDGFLSAVDQNVTAFLEGEDQRSWDRLTRLIEQNAIDAAESEGYGARFQVQS